MQNHAYTGHDRRSPSMINDRRALSLIDTCLRRGSFPREAVAQISDALAKAQREQQCHVARESRR